MVMGRRDGTISNASRQPNAACRCSKDKATSGKFRHVVADAQTAHGVLQQPLAQVIGVNREAMRDHPCGPAQIKAKELAAMGVFLEMDVSEFFVPSIPS